MMSQQFTGKERDAETGLDYFGARYMPSAQGRFTSPDPLGAAAGREADSKSWNLYAYGRNNPLNVDPLGLRSVLSAALRAGRNNPLRYVDPLGLMYQVCDNNGNCSNLDDATFEKERKSGSKNGEYFSGGNLFDFDANGNKVSDGTFAHTDIDSANGPALVGALGRRADAQIQFIGVFAGASVVAGTGVGIGLQATGAGLTILESATPYFRYTTGELKQLIGGAQRELLQQLLGHGEQGALSRLSNLDIPQGLTKETLETYKEAAVRVVQRGPGAPGFQVQQLRLQIVEKALSLLK